MRHASHAKSESPATNLTLVQGVFPVWTECRRLSLGERNAVLRLRVVGLACTNKAAGWRVTGEIEGTSGRLHPPKWRLKLLRKARSKAPAAQYATEPLTTR